ncbi:hypothetical protein [Ruegeria denitrificans]|uniref:hypothetical protein n=1 Tax=Ruegeria denitrificans TaxID=1715692 RepID=UPI0009E9DCC9|nr:hypothetical protein [Ruegeria denitrificans]
MTAYPTVKRSRRFNAECSLIAGKVVFLIGYWAGFSGETFLRFFYAPEAGELASGVSERVSATLVLALIVTLNLFLLLAADRRFSASSYGPNFCACSCSPQVS